MPWLAVCSSPGWPAGPCPVPAYPSHPEGISPWPFSLLQPGGEFLPTFISHRCSSQRRLSSQRITSSLPHHFFPPCLGPYWSAWNSFASYLDTALLRSHLLPRASLVLFIGGHQHQWFPALPHRLASFRQITGAWAAPSGTESGVWGGLESIRAPEVAVVRGQRGTLVGLRCHLLAYKRQHPRLMTSQLGISFFV